MIGIKSIRSQRLKEFQKSKSPKCPTASAESRQKLAKTRITILRFQTYPRPFASKPNHTNEHTRRMTDQRRVSVLESILATQERFALANAGPLLSVHEEGTTTCHLCGEAGTDVTSLPHAGPAPACSVLAHPSCVLGWVKARNARRVRVLRCPSCRVELAGGYPQPPPRTRSVCGTTMHGGACLLPLSHLGPCVASRLPSSN